MNRLQPNNSPRATTESQIAIYCDGACIPNPGIMGIGVVQEDVDRVYSVCLGGGTNQVAELCALRLAIEVARPGDQIFSDSEYAINTTLGRWRASANREIIQDLRSALQAKRGIRLTWIKRCSHSRHALADYLANNAAKICEPRLEPNGSVGPSDYVVGYRPGIEPQLDLSGNWAARVAAEAMRDPQVCESGSAEQKLTRGPLSVGSSGACEVQGVSRPAKASRGVIRRRPRIAKLD